MSKTRYSTQYLLALARIEHLLGLSEKALEEEHGALTVS
jgi:hypothetical protein